MIQILPLFASLAIHAAVLLALLSNAKPPEEQRKEEKKEQSSSLQVTLLTVPQAGPAAKKCPGEMYVGIGVLIVFGSVHFVASGGPADRAGIKVGDMIDEYSIIRNKHPVGTLITLNVIRNNKPLKFKMRVEQICSDV